MTTATTFDTRFRWQANADYHARACQNYWANARRAECDRQDAHTHNERQEAVGRRNRNLMWLMVATGVTEDDLLDAVQAVEAR